MTDNSSQIKTGTGWGKVVGIGVLYFDACQHLTPVFCGWLRARYPQVFDDNLAFEFVVSTEATISACAMKWTPDFIVDSIADGIKWVRSACKKIKDASNQP